MALLTLSNIHVRYGSVEVLHGIDLHVDEGEIVTILGANGAGKSTTLLSISGLVRPCEGEIIFDGKPLLKYPSHEVVNLGIAQSPEGRRVFGTMSVLENLRLGAFCIRDKERSERTLEWIFELFPRLFERKQQEQDAAIAADRRSQVGTGDRSERIRTYNFPQGRVTDHRIGLTLYRIDAIMDGDLDEIIDALITADRAEKLQAAGEGQ